MNKWMIGKKSMKHHYQRKKDLRVIYYRSRLHACRKG